MKKSLLSIACAVISLAIAFNASASKIVKTDINAQKIATEVNRTWKSAEFVKPAHSNISAHSDLTLGPTGGYSIILGPDGSQWYATQSYETKGSYFTASTITLYNSKGVQQGVVNVTIPDGVNVNQILVGDCVSNNLFDKNKNTNEITVILHQIISAGVTAYTTNIYDVASGELKNTYNGHMSLVDYSTGYSTEWVGILSNDTTIEDVNMAKYDVYGKPGWTTQTAELKKTFTLPKNLAEYQVGSPLNVFEIDHSLYYVVSQYEKEYLDPASYKEPWDMIPTPNNNFVATIYDKNFNEKGKISIPVTSTKQVLVQYGVGLFGFNDLSKNYWTDANELQLVVTSTSFNVTNEDENINFDVYGLNNEKVKAIASGMSDWMYMYDVPGEPTQMAFLSSDGSKLSMIDMPECNTAVTFGAQVEGEVITNNIDRYPVGDSYQYVIALASPEKDAYKNYIQRFAWVTKEGTISRQAKFNLGANNASWIPLVMGETLNPFAFDTDDQHEYVFIANQYASGTSGAIIDELRIVKEDGTLVRSYVEDVTKGELGTCNILGLGGECPSLIVPFLNSNTGEFTVEIDFLPLEKFSAGGKGTAEEPYLIASAGDLAMISRDPAAYYKVINDFSASDYGLWNSIPSFTGTLDGDNHTISGLSFNGDNTLVGIFAATEEATIKNLIIESPKADLTDNASTVGLVVADAMTTTISNVHIKNATINSESNTTSAIGCIAGGANLTCVISECSATDFNINTPNATNIGGIAGFTRTSSNINACAVNGSIVADNAIGGIAGETSTDCAVTNCNIDIDINGKNTIGGVVGSADRGGIHACYVKGSLTATEEDWGGYYRVGGIAGSLVVDYSSSESTEEADTVVDPWNEMVISNNVIALSKINTKAGAAHRVVGYTRWEEDLEAAKWDPSVVPTAEPALDKNYVVSTLTAIDNSIETIATSTEGADIAASDINKEFLTALGFAFGSTVDAPWAEFENDFCLYFETGEADGVESIITENVVINYNNGTINVNGAIVTEVYNLNGVKIASGHATIDASNLNKGIYIVAATNATGTKKTAKIAVK